MGSQIANDVKSRNGEGGESDLGHFGGAEANSALRSAHSSEGVETAARQSREEKDYMRIELNKSRDTILGNNSYYNHAGSNPESSHKEYQGYNDNSNNGKLLAAQSGMTTAADGADVNSEAGENRATQDHHSYSNDIHVLRSIPISSSNTDSHSSMVYRNRKVTQDLHHQK